LTVNNIDDDEDSDESSPPVLDQEPVEMFALDSTIEKHLFPQLEQLHGGKIASVPGQGTFEAGGGVVTAHNVVWSKSLLTWSRYTRRDLAQLEYQFTTNMIMCLNFLHLSIMLTWIPNVGKLQPVKSSYK